MTVNSLIDLTLEEIARDYHRGALVWMKANRPNDWRNMLTLEERVNEMALGSDTEGLKRALSDYQRLILATVKEYKALKENKGQGMFNFVESPSPPGRAEVGEMRKGKEQVGRSSTVNT